MKYLLFVLICLQLDSHIIHSCHLVHCHLLLSHQPSFFFHLSLISMHLSSTIYSLSHFSFHSFYQFPHFTSLHTFLFSAPMFHNNILYSFTSCFTTSTIYMLHLLISRTLWLWLHSLLVLSHSFIINQAASNSIAMMMMMKMMLMMMDCSSTTSHWYQFFYASMCNFPRFILTAEKYEYMVMVPMLINYHDQFGSSK